MNNIKENSEEFIYLKDSQECLKLKEKKNKMFSLLKNIEEGSNMLYKAIIKEYPSRYIDNLSKERVAIKDIESFKALNPHTLKFMVDVRSMEELTYNYYLGTLVEVIAAKLLTSLGYDCKRSGL